MMLMRWVGVAALVLAGCGDDDEDNGAEAACEALCDQWARCEEAIPGCARSCTSDVEAKSDGCIEAVEALAECLDGNTCEGEYEACEDQLDEMNDRCDLEAGYTTEHFDCDNGEKIFAEWECDGEDDCGDNSDEDHC